MKATVKNISNTKVQVTITLGEAELADARLAALHKMAKDIKVDGFRRGHAPIAMVEKQVNPQLLEQQVLDDALSKAVADAFIKHDIKAIERPSVEVQKYVLARSLSLRQNQK